MQRLIMSSVRVVAGSQDTKGQDGNGGRLGSGKEQSYYYPAMQYSQDTFGQCPTIKVSPSGDKAVKHSEVQKPSVLGLD